MPHPLDAWLESLTPVRDGDLVAYPVAKYGLMPPSETLSRDAPADQIALARMCFRPADAEVREYFDGSDLIAHHDWPGAWGEWGLADCTDTWLEARTAGAPHDDPRAWLRAWLLSTPAILAGTKLPLVPPEPLFSVGLGVTSMASSVWGWGAVALTADLAVVGDWDEESGPLRRCLGVVARATLTRSTALLFQECGPLDFPDRFDGEGFWDEISYRGLSHPELYRLLVASTRGGGQAIRHLDGPGLRTYREVGMKKGYRSIARVATRMP